MPKRSPSKSQSRMQEWPLDISPSHSTYSHGHPSCLSTSTHTCITMGALQTPFRRQLVQIHPLCRAPTHSSTPHPKSKLATDPNHSFSLPLPIYTQTMTCSPSLPRTQQISASKPPALPARRENASDMPPETKREDSYSQILNF